MSNPRSERISHLLNKQGVGRVTESGLITPTMTWEDHIELEALLDDEEDEDCDCGEDTCVCA